MHNFIRMTAFVAVMAGSAVPVAAATQNEFYSNLLRRGMASYDASRYPDAAKQLRIAAFGLVDTIEQYQIAQMYLTLTYDKLGENDRAREAAHRVIVAERVERKYAAVTIAPAIRSAFETVAGRLLTPAELAMLHGGPMPPAPPQASRSTSSATPPRTTTTTAQTSAPPRTTVNTAQTTAPPRTTTATTTPAKTPQTASATPPTTTSSQPRVSMPTQQSQTAEHIPPQAITPTPAPAKPRADPPPVTRPLTKPAPAPAKTATTATTQSEGRGGPIEPPRSAPATAAPAPTKIATTVTTQAEGRGGPMEPLRSAPVTAVPAPAPRPLSATEISTRLATAERALNGSNLSEGRRVFRELLAAQGLDHETLIRVAEGLYRSRDFTYALNAFNRIGTLRRGEEPYRYYIAVAAYETGDYARAKKELAGALLFIEITPDVARYRTRIEGAQ